MTLDQNRLAFASAGTFGILYVVCALFVWIAPDAALMLLGWLAHIVNVEKFAGDVVVAPFELLAGLVQILMYSYIAGWIFAWVYNRSQKSS